MKAFHRLEQSFNSLAADSIKLNQQPDCYSVKPSKKLQYKIAN